MVGLEIQRYRSVCELLADGDIQAAIISYLEQGVCRTVIRAGISWYWRTTPSHLNATIVCLEDTNVASWQCLISMTCVRM